MEITSFDDLLEAARLQPEPQRLLFVFARAELPDAATALQRTQFDAGEGGELVPLMTVDKAPAELSGFAAFDAEAAQAGPPWSIVFVAGLSGRGGVPPTGRDAESALNRMVDAIKSGRLEGLLPFDRRGEPLRFV